MSLWERFACWLAWKLPRTVAYHAAIRVGAHATQGVWSATEVGALRFMDAVKRWEVDA